MRTCECVFIWEFVGVRWLLDIFRIPREKKTVLYNWVFVAAIYCQPKTKPYTRTHTIASNGEREREKKLISIMDG